MQTRIDTRCTPKTQDITAIVRGSASAYSPAQIVHIFYYARNDVSVTVRLSRQGRLRARGGATWPKANARPRSAAVTLTRSEAPGRAAGSAASVVTSRTGRRTSLASIASASTVSCAARAMATSNAATSSRRATDSGGSVSASRSSSACSRRSAGSSKTRCASTGPRNSASRRNAPTPPISARICSSTNAHQHDTKAASATSVGRGEAGVSLASVVGR